MNSSKGKLSSHGPWVHGHNFLPFCQAENRPPLTCFSALRLGFPIAAMQCLGLIAGTFSCTGGGGPSLGWEKKMLSDVYLLASERGSFFFFHFFCWIWWQKNSCATFCMLEPCAYGSSPRNTAVILGVICGSPLAPKWWAWWKVWNSACMQSIYFAN